MSTAHPTDDQVSGVFFHSTEYTALASCRARSD